MKKAYSIALFIAVVLSGCTCRAQVVDEAEATATFTTHKLIIYSHSNGKLGSYHYDDYDIEWEPLFLATSWYFYRGNDHSKVDVDICKARAKSMKRGKIREANGPLILDIEQFKFVDGDWEHGQLQLRRAANVYRQALPHLRLGFYSIMPRRDYWTPVLYRNQPHRLDYKARFEAWEKHNSLFKADRRDSLGRRSFDGLSDLVDFVSPSLYSPNLSMGGNRTYLIENIKQARRYGKPIIPWMWTQVHDASTHKDADGNPLALTYCGDELLRQQLELLVEMRVEGVVFLEFKNDKLEESFFEVLAAIQDKK